MSLPRILIADDDEGIRQVLSLQLEDAGYGVWAARDGLEAMELFRSEQPDVVITDLRMPYKDGQGVLESILAQNANAVVILMTAFGSVDAAVAAMKAGAFDFIIKPFHEADMLAAVERALEMARLRCENRALRQTLTRTRQEDMAEIPPGVRDVYERAAQIADADVPVLIRGETGTGKEYLARFIHRSSSRADHAWVAVNCGALPDHLVDAELFGHTKGAFTGAVKARRGRILAADGGILFLDEIGDLPLSAQAKLLRFLQEGEVHPLGEDMPRHADARVLAATHRDLERMVAEGSFREDLYYRLNVVEARLPPLRDRSGDIPALARQMTVEAAERMQWRPVEFSRAAMKLLQSYPWPGNLRQLKNFCERLTVLYPGKEVDESRIRVELPDPPMGDDRQIWLLPPAGINLADMEASLIRQALDRSGWKKSAAARLLGLSRHTLDYRIEKFSIIQDSKQSD